MSSSNPVAFAKALADVTRQRIMHECCCQWVSVGELVERVGLSQPTVSHHLAVLREAGLVYVRHEGKQSFYSLNQQHVAQCCGQLVAVFAPEVATAKDEC
jgi:ArsR family transcriptional regulator